MRKGIQQRFDRFDPSVYLQPPVVDAQSKRIVVQPREQSAGVQRAHDDLRCKGVESTAWLENFLCRLVKSCLIDFRAELTAEALDRQVA